MKFALLCALVFLATVCATVTLGKRLQAEPERIVVVQVTRSQPRCSDVHTGRSLPEARCYWLPPVEVYNADPMWKK